MINKKNSCIFLLTLFVLYLPSLLYAEKHIDFTGSRFNVGKGASVQIGESASITVSNIIIETNITGKGKLIVVSDNNAYIHANNNSIENLVLISANKVKLLSGLQIKNELTILKGELQLNNFDLTLCPNAKLDNSSLQRIIMNGSGSIVQQSIGIPYAAKPFTISSPVQFDFSQIPALIVNDKREAMENIFHYTLSFTPDRTPDVLVPPPKA